MKLSLEGIASAKEWEAAGITLPAYDVRALQEKTKKAPKWIHFGSGNIFRIFLGGATDKMIEDGIFDTGIICAETFDYDVVDYAYRPFDNLSISVTLFKDGTTDKRVVGSLVEAIKVESANEEAWNRLKQIFTDPGLMMASFSITEKGYALYRPDGVTYFPYVKADVENGPSKVTGAMGVITAMLWERFLAGAFPMAVVSMDNCSRNGKVLQTSVMQMASEWCVRGFVSEAFMEYLKDETKISFPWSMIDKITPSPAQFVAEMLKADGVEDMETFVTSKQTRIAPFVNAEAPQYLVIEDSFPNGRPPFEKAGIYMVDRETVDKAEKMKVMTCLNPVHTGVAPWARLLGVEMFADTFKDEDLYAFARLITYVEGMPVVTDPGVISPQAFLDELFYERFVNEYLGDTVFRNCCEITQGIGIRFGETIRSYVERYGTARMLKAAPLAIAGYLRYCLGYDDEGNPYELSPDPMVDEWQEIVQKALAGDKEPLHQLLANANIFHINLYDADVADKVEEIFFALCERKGCTREVLRKYMAD